MAEAHSSDPGSIRAGYEISDLSPRGIALFAAGLAVMIVVSLVAVYALLELLRDGRREAAETPAPPATASAPAPGPRLLVEPGRAFKAMREQEQTWLKSYGWIDQEKGIAHIPIDRAIEMLAQKGLPARQTKPGAETQRRAQEPVP